jgi:hypothetical protein
MEEFIMYIIMWKTPTAFGGIVEYCIAYNKNSVSLEWVLTEARRLASDTLHYGNVRVYQSDGINLLNNTQGGK